MNKFIKAITTSAIILSILIVGKAALASEVTGNLSTGINSTVGNTVNGVVMSPPVASISAGTYTTTQSVVLTAIGATSIHYTIDGSLPSCSIGLVYSGSITVSISLTIEALSCYSNSQFSTVASYAYVINIPAAVSSGGGGGGGGGGSSSPTVTVVPVVITPTPVVVAPIVIPVTQPIVVVPQVLGEQVVNVTATEQSLVIKTDQALTRKLAGRILLQVESHGEAWYLDPSSLKKFYLADGSSAYTALRTFGLGIKNIDLEKIPVGVQQTAGGVSSILTSTVKNNAQLVNRLKGKILLQVENHGEAWYVNPVDGKRYYMANGDAAYQIMRYLSLGINNSNLRKINVGDINAIKK